MIYGQSPADFLVGDYFFGDNEDKGKLIDDHRPCYLRTTEDSGLKPIVY